MDLDHSGSLEPAELLQCYLIIRKFLQDTNKVALFRTAQSSKQRMAHIQYALASSQYVRFANDTRDGLLDIQEMLADLWWTPV